MTKCRSEGELRASLDREMPQSDLEAMAAHLAICVGCSGRLSILERRATAVSAMIDELQCGAPVAVPVRPSAWRWLAAGAALAAGLSAVFLIYPRRETPPPPAVHAAVSQPVPAVSAKPPAAVREPRPAVARKRPPEVQYFFALDDDPIDMGVVQRVALGPASVPADVIFSPDGRARAIRLVSNASFGGQQ